MRTFGIQTFTIRKEMKDDLDLSIKKIRDLGIKQIEGARMPIDQHTIEVLKKNRIDVLSLQLTYHKLVHREQEIIRFCKEMKTKHVIISVLPLWARVPLCGYTLFASKVNELISRYEKVGIEVSFHHHDYEMKKTKQGLILDRILKHINPKLGLIIDTYWITKMKQDPIDIYLKYKNRIKGMHLREYGKSGQHYPIGEGTVDFKTILNTIDQHVYTVIEQKTDSPFQDIKKALTHLEEINESKAV